MRIASPCSSRLPWEKLKAGAVHSRRHELLQCVRISGSWTDGRYDLCFTHGSCPSLSLHTISTQPPVLGLVKTRLWLIRLMNQTVGANITISGMIPNKGRRIDT